MVKVFTLKEILDLNPHIDKEDLEELKKTLRIMQTGRAKRHYSLIPPFARPRVTVGEGDKTDSRTIILRQTKQ